MKYLALILIMTASAQADWCKDYGKEVAKVAKHLQAGRTLTQLMNDAKAQGVDSRYMANVEWMIYEAAILSERGLKGRKLAKEATITCRQTAQ